MLSSGGAVRRAAELGACSAERLREGEALDSRATTRSGPIDSPSSELPASGRLSPRRLKTNPTSAGRKTMPHGVLRPAVGRLGLNGSTSRLTARGWAGVTYWSLLQNDDGPAEGVTADQRSSRKRLASVISGLLSPCSQGSSSLMAIVSDSRQV